MAHRIEKINELIKQKVAEILMRELALKPGIFMTIAKVDTTPDLRYTRIFMSVFPENEARYVFTALEREISRIQGRLNKVLAIKTIPRIQFRLDTTEVAADKIEKLFQEIGDE